MAIRDRIRRVLSRSSDHSITSSNRSLSFTESTSSSNSTTLPPSMQTPESSQQQHKRNTSSLSSMFSLSSLRRRAARDHQKRLTREEAIAAWKPPHRLKYPAVPDPRHVRVLEQYSWGGDSTTRRLDGVGEEDGENLSPTATACPQFFIDASEYSEYSAGIEEAAVVMKRPQRDIKP